MQQCYNENTGACDFSKNGFRLPTEAEWEYACRAGTETIFYTGNALSLFGKSTDIDLAGWYFFNSSNKTHPVGQKLPNAWRLYDMHGNVSEWCNDLYGSYISDNQSNPTGAQTGSFRVIRGGGWGSSAGGCRSVERFGGPTARTAPDLGFRVVSRAQ